MGIQRTACLLRHGEWRDDVLDDTEEYEVLFEEQDVTTRYLSCSLIADCSNVEEEELVLPLKLNLDNPSLYN